MEPTKRLWGVLDHGLANLSQEESVNANKDIAQAIEDINTLKAKAELFDEAIDFLFQSMEHLKYGSDLHHNIRLFLSKAKELK